MRTSPKHSFIPEYTQRKSVNKSFCKNQVYYVLIFPTRIKCKDFRLLTSHSLKHPFWNSLVNSFSNVSFLYALKKWKTSGFLMFSGVIERKNWKMILIRIWKTKRIQSKKDGLTFYKEIFISIICRMNATDSLVLSDLWEICSQNSVTFVKLSGQFFS